MVYREVFVFVLVWSLVWTIIGVGYIFEAAKWRRQAMAVKQASMRYRGRE